MTTQTQPVTNVSLINKNSLHPQTANQSYNNLVYKQSQYFHASQSPFRHVLNEPLLIPKQNDNQLGQKRKHIVMLLRKINHLQSKIENLKTPQTLNLINYHHPQINSPQLQQQQIKHNKSYESTHLHQKNNLHSPLKINKLDSPVKTSKLDSPSNKLLDLDNYSNTLKEQITTFHQQNNLLKEQNHLLKQQNNLLKQQTILPKQQNNFLKEQNNLLKEQNIHPKTTLNSPPTQIYPYIPNNQHINNEEQVNQRLIHYSQQSKMFVRSSVHITNFQQPNQNQYQPTYNIPHQAPQQSLSSPQTVNTVKKANSFRRKSAGKILFVKLKDTINLGQQANQINNPSFPPSQQSFPAENDFYPEFRNKFQDQNKRNIIKDSNSMSSHKLSILEREQGGGKQMPKQESVEVGQLVRKDKQGLIKSKQEGRKIKQGLINLKGFQRISQNRTSRDRIKKSVQKKIMNVEKLSKKDKEKEKVNQKHQISPDQFNQFNQNQNHNQNHHQQSSSQSNLSPTKQIHLLQFNTENEKYDVSNMGFSSLLNQKKPQTEKKPQINYNSINVSSIKTFQQLHKLLPKLPTLPNPPFFENTQEEFLTYAKSTFALFHVNSLENPDTDLNVKKFKNCVFFAINSHHNILSHYDGKFYFGSWKNNDQQGQGEKSGEGLEFYPSKYLFQGQFSHGKRNGQGILHSFHSSTESIYIGQFVNGKKQGRGKLIDSVGNIYEGQWYDDKKHGFGLYQYADGQVYEGTFATGEKKGFGVQNFKNGDLYRGEYNNNKFQGKGQYIWKNSAQYEGEFSNGKRNGQGLWKSTSDSNAQIYEGTYLNDKKNGYGIYKWPNGSFYQGQFKADKKHGVGMTRYENGKIAVMQWSEGVSVRKVEREEWPEFVSDQNQIEFKSEPKKVKINTLISSQLQSNERKAFSSRRSKLRIQEEQDLFVSSRRNEDEQFEQINVKRIKNQRLPKGEELRQAKYQPVGVGFNVFSL